MKYVNSKTDYKEIDQFLGVQLNVIPSIRKVKVFFLFLIIQIYKLRPIPSISKLIYNLQSS